MVSAAASLPSSHQQEARQIGHRSPERLDLNTSSHIYPHVTIAGNAQVQLGDQYLGGENDLPAKPERKENELCQSLHIAASVVHLSDFSSKLLREFGSREHGTIVQFKHSSLFAIYEILQARTRALSYSARHIAQDSAQPSNHILLEVVNRSVQIASVIEEILQEEFDNAQHPQIPTSEQWVESNPYSNGSEGVLLALEELSLLLVISLVIVISKSSNINSSLEEINLEETEKIILNVVKQFVSEKEGEVVALTRALLPKWFSRPSAATTSKVIDSWLSQYRSLTVPYVKMISDTVALVREKRVRRVILNGLSFPEIRNRYTAISQAQARTFDWLFDMQGDTQVSGHNFASWLASSDPASCGLYWISGKPGSGKSTLMRYLHDQPRTGGIARSWCSTKTLVIASCFFWSSGTSLQKSQQGMLQTLLYHLLATRNDFSGHLFLCRWHLQNLVPAQQDPWSVDELRLAIFNFIHLYRSDLKFLFLIDGLDEYEGNDSERLQICALLCDLSNDDCVKVCASSRAWNVYKDAFRLYPKLQLEDLTRQDIQNYVVDRFSTNEHYQAWSQVNIAEAQQLIESITTRAQGVFLWVYLAVHSLLSGVQNGDDAQELAARLQEIPVDLQEYFRLIMSTVPSRYLEQASQMFELALLQSHLLLIYYFTHSKMHEVNWEESSQADIQEAILRIESREERRINARCMGLLETVSFEAECMQYSLHRVDFLHRTAKDFIASPETQAQLLSYRKGPFNAKLTLFKAIGQLLQSYTQNGSWLDSPLSLRYLTFMLRLAQEMPGCEAEVTRILTDVQPNLDLNLKRVSSSRNTRTGFGEGHDEKEWGKIEAFAVSLPGQQVDLLGLSIEARIDSYALGRLRTPDAPALLRREGRPLLDYALFPARSELRPFPGLSPPSVAMVGRLLEIGADPNDTWPPSTLRPSSTIWSRYLRVLEVIHGLKWGNEYEAQPSERENDDDDKDRRPHELTQRAEVARLLIAHGAVDVVKVNDHNGVRTIRAKALFAEIFPPEVAAELSKQFSRSAHGSFKARARRIFQKLL